MKYNMIIWQNYDCNNIVLIYFGAKGLNNTNGYIIEKNFSKKR